MIRVSSFAGVSAVMLLSLAACSSGSNADDSGPSGSNSNGASSSANAGTSSSSAGTTNSAGNSSANGGSSSAGAGATSTGGNSTAGQGSGVGGVGAGGSGNTSGGAGNSSAGSAGTSGSGAAGSSAGGSGNAGSAGNGSAGSSAAGSGNAGSGNAGSGGDLISTITSNVTWYDDQHNPVDAHGGGLNRIGDTFYMSGEYFVYTAGASETTNNSFHGFSMYSSKDLVNWHFERLILPQQASGELGPMRNGERPHIIQCPSTGEFVLYAHAASLDYQTDKEVVYATSPTINGLYSYQGPLKNAQGQTASHSDMSAYVDSNNVPYVVTESGSVYKLAADCHSWLSDQNFGAMANMESPAPFKAGSTYFWIMSNKTGWRANDDEYATAPSMTGPWTNQGLIAPTGEKTWLSQSTAVLPIVGTKGTVYLYWGDHWDGTESTDHPGRNNSLATYVWQPIVINGTSASMPVYYATWKLDITAGTWSQ